MDQQHSQSDSGTGTRLDSDPVLWLYVKRNMEWELDQERRRQNRLIFLDMARTIKMREVKSLAESIKESVANVRQLTIDAKNELVEETKRAIGNASKVRSFTKDLKDANGEVEALLGDTGSNFPPEDGDTPLPSGDTPHPKHDINNVTLNPEAKGK